jgi:hypothetical protein
MKELSYDLVRTGDVIGVCVTNTSDEDLGKIEEIVLNKFTGETHYAVLSFGGVFGVGDKLFALPWKILTYDPDKEKFVIHHSKEHLKNAPGFSKDHWPNMADTSWQSSIDKFYQSH